VLQNPPGQSIGIVWAISAAGQSAGDVTGNGPYNTVEAVLWSPSGQPTVLQDAGGYGDSGAYAINDSGQSAGFSFVAPGSGGGEDAVLWSPSGDATVLQDVGGYGFSEAHAINDSGESVGFSLTAGGHGYSAAGAINASGQSVGSSYTEPGLYGLGDYEAVLWSPSGKATVLQDVGGYGESAAVAINASGWSVGYSCNFPDSYCPTDKIAALWSPTGAGTNLGAVLGPAWSDTVAVGLNNLGDIIGYGDYHGAQYGFLLAPVPEPSTWAMLLAGFAGLGLAGYRSARKGGAAVALAGRTPAS
jgi:hypothetical protein